MLRQFNDETLEVVDTAGAVVAKLPVRTRASRADEQTTERARVHRQQDGGESLQLEFGATLGESHVVIELRFDYPASHGFRWARR